VGGTASGKAARENSEARRIAAGGLRVTDIRYARPEIRIAPATAGSVPDFAGSVPDAGRPPRRGFAQVRAALSFAKCEGGLAKCEAFSLRVSGGPAGQRACHILAEQISLTFR